MNDLHSNSNDRPFWLEIRARHVFAIAVLLGLAGILFLARAELGPYIIGITFAYFLLPIVRRIESWIPAKGRLSKVHRPVATIVAVILTIGGVILLITLLAKPITDEMDQLADDFPAYWEDLTNGGSFADWYGDNVPAGVQTWMNENVGRIGEALLSAVASVLSFFFTATGNVVDVVVAFAVIPIFMAYVLIDRPNAGKLVRTLLPEQWVDDTVQILRLGDGIMASYTRGVVYSSVIVGVITGLGYWVIGVDLWVSLGVIAFLGEIVPILGPWIAFFISFPVVLVTQPELAIPAVIVFGVIQALEGWFISPKIQGESIELPSSLVLISLAIGGAVAGPIGIVLALPAVAIIRAIVIYTVRRLDHARPEVASVGLLPELPKKAEKEQELLEPAVAD